MNINEVLKSLSLSEKAHLLVGEEFLELGKIPEKGIGEFLSIDGSAGLNFEQLFQCFCMNEDKCVDDDDILNRVTERFFDVYLQEKKSELSSGDDSEESEEEILNEDELELYDWLMDRLDSRSVLGEMYPPTCFPGGLLLGSTWNEQAIKSVGEALADEAKVYKVKMLYGTPFVNLMRDPRAGRSFEAYSEDPYLTGQLARYMVKGVQSHGVAANVKHYAANNQETNRRNVSEIITKRAMEELYLPAFDACVEEDVATVMSAYNSINGVRCTENYDLLTKRLRDEKGFKGAVMSDYGAVRDDVRAVAAGNDLIMPGPHSPKAIIEAVEDGTLDESVVDTAVLRVLKLHDRFGESTLETDSQFKLQKASSKAALDAALEGIVMLKNEDIFPLKGSVSLMAQDDGFLFDCGVGSAGVHTSRKFSLADELKKAGKDFTVRSNVIDKKTDTVLVVVRTKGREGNDMESMSLPVEERNRIDSAIREVKSLKAYGKNIKIGVILNIAAPVLVEEFRDSVDGIMCCFLPGTMGSAALAKIMSGEVSPSGRLPVSFPKREEDLPTYINFHVDGNSLVYGEDIFVGYRYYNTKKMDVSYPFGYGLSYTEFEYDEMELSSNIFDGELDVSVNVKNVGTVTGSEVVQLYISDVYSTIRKPERELKAFKKVKIAPGESKKVTFHLTKKDFASFDMDLDKWEAEEGLFDIYLGKNATEIIGEKRVLGKWKSAYSYSQKTVVKVLYENEETRELLYRLADDFNIDRSFVDKTYEYGSCLSVRDMLSEKVDVSSPDVMATLKVFEEELSAVTVF